MPLICQEHTVAEHSPAYFSQVLREQTELLDTLNNWPMGWRAFEGVFNGQPLALILIAPVTGGWEVKALAVHPASRHRGVGSTLLQSVAKQVPTLQWPSNLQALAERNNTLQ